MITFPEFIENPPGAVKLPADKAKPPSTVTVPVTLSLFDVC